jgi:hypothetical protein
LAAIGVPEALVVVGTVVAAFVVLVLLVLLAVVICVPLDPQAASTIAASPVHITRVIAVIRLCGRLFVRGVIALLAGVALLGKAIQPPADEIDVTEPNLPPYIRGG